MIEWGKAKDESREVSDSSAGDNWPVRGGSVGALLSNLEGMQLNETQNSPIVPVVPPGVRPVASPDGSVGTPVAMADGVRESGGELESLQRVAKDKKKGGNCNGLQRGRKPKAIRGLTPPQMEGYSWRPEGHSGWDLWRRVPTISANGKPSSKHTYVAYYSFEKVAKLRLQKNNEQAKRKSKTKPRRVAK